MMIGRVGEWMEWNGAVKGGAGVGVAVGVWGGGGARGEGEGKDNRSILDCNNMMTVLCVSCAKQTCFVKSILSSICSL